MKKDYYKILGIQPNASQEDIKKSFRKLAMTHHPDKGGDEATFKEITESYDVLSDSDKKFKYDNNIDGNPFGNGGNPFGNGGNPFGGFNAEEIFSQFFNQQRIKKGSDLRIKVILNINEIINGCNRKAKYQRFVAKNNKIISIEDVIDIDFPPGVGTGMILNMQGKGNEILDGQAGDLHIIIEETIYTEFTRVESDLVYDKKLRIVDFVLGSNFDIDAPTGKIQIKISEGTEVGSKQVFNGRGLPIIDMNGNVRGKGNIIVNFSIEIPKNLSAEKKLIFEQLKNI